MVTHNIADFLKQKSDKQKQYYDRASKLLPPLNTGEVVRMRTADGWKVSTVMSRAPEPRSYIVQKEGRKYRRNRRDLRRTNEAYIGDFPPENPVINDDQTDYGVNDQPLGEVLNQQMNNADGVAPIAEPAQPPLANISRVSGRVIKKPY